MHKYIVFLFFIIAFFTTFFLLKSNLIKTTMKYFPTDKYESFEYAKTELYTLQQDKNIHWGTESMSSKIAYLRQDVSLLYENGKFKGVQSEWEQHLDKLKLSKRFQQSSSSLLQVISFHHGELHYPNDQINSIQKMTGDQLYIIIENDNLHSFRKPHTAFEKRWEIKLNEMMEQQTKGGWKSLINYFSISKEQYDSFPLTELIQYETTTIPGRSKQETKKIIGQLWEGLYKNYIVLLHEKENRESPHDVPLIMIAKDNDHLLVIFELNKEKQMLKQKL